MSDIQDIITSASIKAFNSGLAHGVVQERDRIINLLENFDDSNLWRQVGFNPDAYEGFNVRELIDIIKGEQK